MPSSLRKSFGKLSLDVKDPWLGAFTAWQKHQDESPEEDVPEEDKQTSEKRPLKLRVLQSDHST